MRGRDECVEGLRTQAETTLAEIEPLLGTVSPTMTISRAYYAAFYAASALLMARELRPKSHQGVVDLLHREFVREGRLDRDTVAAYRHLYGMRLVSDYGPFEEATPEAAQSAVAFAREFLETVEKLLTPDE